MPGYSSTFFVNPLTEDQICPICNLGLKDPVKVVTGKIVCLTCVEGRDYESDIIKNEEMSNLQVSCTIEAYEVTFTLQYWKEVSIN